MRARIREAISAGTFGMLPAPAWWVSGALVVCWTWSAWSVGWVAESKRAARVRPPVCVLGAFQVSWLNGFPGAWGAYASSPQRYRIDACPIVCMPQFRRKVNWW